MLIVKFDLYAFLFYSQSAFSICCCCWHPHLVIQMFNCKFQNSTRPLSSLTKQLDTRQIWYPNSTFSTWNDAKWKSKMLKMFVITILFHAHTTLEERDQRWIVATMMQGWNWLKISSDYFIPNHDIPYSTIPSPASDSVRFHALEHVRMGCSI